MSYKLDGDGSYIDMKSPDPPYRGENVRSKTYLREMDSSLFHILGYMRDTCNLLANVASELGDIRRDGIIVSKKVVLTDDEAGGEETPSKKALESIDVLQNYIEMDFSATRSGFKGLIQELEELRMHMNKFSNDHGEGVE